jgi:hypothetical protein
MFHIMNYGILLRKLRGSVIAGALLVSCAVHVPVSPFSPVNVTGSAVFRLLPTIEIEKNIDSAQQMTGRYIGQTFVMTAYVKADESGIDMTFFNDLGSDIGSLSFNDQAVSFHSPIFTSPFKAEYLAADFQFCFYRPEALRQALEGQNLRFDLIRRSGGDTEIRRISEERETIIEIEKTANRVRYTNFFRGYGFTIEEAL